jgi:hypothetical protein
LRPKAREKRLKACTFSAGASTGSYGAENARQGARSSQAFRRKVFENRPGAVM